MDKSKTKINLKIDEIISEFDFIKVHKVMTLLNWTWYNTNGVPKIGYIVLTARQKLIDCYDKLIISATENECWIDSGGFKAKSFKTNHGKIEFSLEFILEEKFGNYDE